MRWWSRSGHRYGVDVAKAPKADAYCPPGYQSGGLIPAYNWGQEWNYQGTCDWDNTYHGWLIDNVTDGSCVWAEYIDDGWWGVQAYTCTTGAWIDYWKWDNNGDFSSSLNLCRNQGCYTGGYWPWSSGY